MTRHSFLYPAPLPVPTFFCHLFLHSLDKFPYHHPTYGRRIGSVAAVEWWIWSLALPFPSCLCSACKLPCPARALPLKLLALFPLACLQHPLPAHLPPSLPPSLSPSLTHLTPSSHPLPSPSHPHYLTYHLALPSQDRDRDRKGPLCLPCLPTCHHLCLSPSPPYTSL